MRYIHNQNAICARVRCCAVCCTIAQ